MPLTWSTSVCCTAVQAYQSAAHRRCLVGLGSFVCTFTYMYIWVYTGEIGTKRLREKYLQAVLRQDIAYFDNVGAGEVATRIQTDTRASPSHLLYGSVLTAATDLVQLGTSEKVPVVVSYIAAFFTGMILAYVRSWRLALALTSMIPCIGITGAVMNKFVASYKQYVYSSDARYTGSPANAFTGLLSKLSPLREVSPRRSFPPSVPRRRLAPKRSSRTSTMSRSIGLALPV